jgi:[ribosomal protein S18]-alanine N-acetyltransferase
VTRPGFRGCGSDVASAAGLGVWDSTGLLRIQFSGQMPPRTSISDEDFARLEIGPLDQDAAEDVAAWSYPGVYAFYDFAADADDLAELLDAESRVGRYFSASLPAHGLVGFVEIKPAGEDSVEIGLGLRPDCTGRGFGRAFVTHVCAWTAKRCGIATIILRVAAFNARAIAVYERVGFEPAGFENVATNGTTVRFLTMTMPSAAVRRAAH